MMVSSGDDQEKAIPQWLTPIVSTEFYSLCETHHYKKHNYCIVCMVTLCDKCKTQHAPSEHKMIRAYKNRKDTSFRMNDLKSLWDISDIHLYISNKRPVIDVHKKGDGIARSDGGPAKCESCQYSFQSPGANAAKYCSVQCKIEAVTKMNGSESTKNEAKKKVETIPVGSSSNVKFKKRPRKQKNPQRAPLR